MYLVFDVGATFVKYAIMNIEGEFILKGKYKTPNGIGQGVDDFVASVHDIYRQYKDIYTLEGIAFGLPGQVDVEHGIVYVGGGLRYMDNVPLGELIANACDQLPVSVENDGKCAALAEIWLGNAKDCKDACVLVFGTGIGGGIIIDRKVHHGNRMKAGEISFCYDRIERKDLDRICPIESFVDLEESFDALPFIWATNNAVRPLIYRVANAKGMSYLEVTGELIYQWASEGDTQVQEILEDAYFDIAKYCCNLYVTLDPDVILIGGGISAQPLFYEGILRYVERLKGISAMYKDIRIDVCKYRNDSNLYGAMYNFMQKYGMINESK